VIKRAGLFALGCFAASFLDEAGRGLANRLMEKWFPLSEAEEDEEVGKSKKRKKKKKKKKS
jgi:hypothetical protein